MSGSRMNVRWAIPRSMFLRVLIPALFSSFALGLSNIADALTVGNRVGGTGLAAIGIVTPVYLMYNLLCIGIATGGSVTHVRLTAKGEHTIALANFRRILLCLLGISAGIALLGNLFLDTLLRILAAGEDYPALWQMCTEYARPLISACPAFMINFLLYSFVQNDDNPRLAALGFSVSSALDFVLNILFVLVFHWGVRGAVWATITAQLVSIAILSAHLFGKKGVLRLKSILTARTEPADRIHRSFWMSFRIGLPSSMVYVFQFTFQLVMNRILMRAGRTGMIAGDLYVAVFDLLLNISYVVYSVYSAAAESMQPPVATFSVEQDRESLRYTRQLAMKCSLAGGAVIALLLGILADPVSAVFGLRDEKSLSVAVPAVRIFLLSSFPGGIIMLLTRYYQALDKPWKAGMATFLRGLVSILLAVAVGLLFPKWIWWIFPVSEALSLVLIQWVLHRADLHRPGYQCPVCRIAMTNDNHELGEVVDTIARFCDAQDIPPGRSAQLQLAVEELCSVTMQKAFSGRENEYIQVVLVVEPGSRYILHIRDSAPFFNPLDLRMEKARQDMETSLMDSIGVLMIRKQSQSMIYRNYQGFNTLTVIYSA